MYGYYLPFIFHYNTPKNLNKIDFYVINTMVNLKNIIGIVLMLSVILMSGCSAPEDSTEQNGDETSPQIDNATQPSADEVVATVNGEEITSEEVTEIQQLFSMRGQQISEEDALEQMIDQKVIVQQAQEKGYGVTNQEAESTIESQLAQQNATLEQYKQQLEMQGLSYEEQLQAIRNDLMIQNYITSALEENDFNVTQEEAQEFYELYKAQSSEEIASYEELEPQIIATLKQQKQQEAINTLVQELREEADVEYK
jgi:peptidyl-prolyl cis-trans isomerase SurA